MKSIQTFLWLTCLALALPVSAARAQSGPFQAGASARGIFLSEPGSDDDESIQVYDSVAPWVRFSTGRAMMRLEVGYYPLYYIPVYGLPGERATLYHTGRLTLASNPRNWLSVNLTDELAATPTGFATPSDSPTDLVQTNNARLSVSAQRRLTRAVSSETTVTQARFDSFDALTEEQDYDDDGVLDAAEDLNGNGQSDSGLRPGYNETSVAQTFWRSLSPLTRVGLSGGVALRRYDEIESSDNDSGAVTVRAQRRVNTTMSADVDVGLRRYAFTRSEEEVHDSVESSAGLSWQATRVMGFGIRAGYQERGLDIHGLPQKTADVAATMNRRLARGAMLVANARLVTVKSHDVANDAPIDAGEVAAHLSFPLRSRMNVDLGTRFWRGGGADVGWSNNHLIFVGVAWE